MLNLEKEVKAFEIVSDETKKEREAFERDKDDIRKRFPEGYVAIHGEKVVDNDPNWFDLSCRAEEKYGAGKVYVVNVDDQKSI